MVKRNIQLRILSILLSLILLLGRMPYSVLAADAEEVEIKAVPIVTKVEVPNAQSIEPAAVGDVAINETNFRILFSAITSARISMKTTTVC